MVVLERERHLQAEALVEVLNLWLVVGINLTAGHYIKCSVISISVSSPGQSKDVTVSSLDNDGVPGTDPAGVTVGAVTPGDQLDLLSGWGLNIPVSATSIAPFGAEDEVNFILFPPVDPRPS